MLPEVNRLKRKKDFGKVFKEGKGFREDFFILKVASNNLGRNRFGIIVSQKVSKKATFRNRIRRQLGELIRMKLAKMEKGRDVILIATPKLISKDFWEIEKAVDKIFARAKILKSKLGT